MTGYGFPAGSIVGRYEILELLGAGGMGEVYRARDGSLGRDVALKILPSRLTIDPHRVQRFITEAKAASALNHPTIVTIHEIGEAEGAEGSGTVRYIAMELVEGTTLGEWLHEQRPLPVVLELMGQIARGVGRAHQRGVVHRDLKPDNIMVTVDGDAKILDFGLAKLLEPNVHRGEAAGSPKSPATLTRPGPFGTAGYMSPEQVEGGDIDHRADIFSLGCIIYEGIIGAPPFGGTTTAEMLHSVVHREPDRLDDPGLQRILDRCLAKNRDERYDSAMDLALDLLELAREVEVPRSPRRRKSRSFRPGRSVARRLGSVLLLCLVVGLPGFAVLNAVSGRDDLRMEREQSADLRLSLEERDRRLALKDLEIEQLKAEGERLDRMRREVESSYSAFLASVSAEISEGKAEDTKLRRRLETAENELGKLREDQNEQARAAELDSIRRELSSMVTAEGDGEITVSIPGTAFDTARSAADPRAWPLVQTIAAQLREYPRMRARIEGHADSDGDADENLALSEQRAATVRELLVRAGVDPERLKIFGHGEMKPLFSNDTSRGRILNRRVEIVISY